MAQGQRGAGWAQLAGGHRKIITHLFPTSASLVHIRRTDQEHKRVFYSVFHSQGRGKRKNNVFIYI